MPQYLAIDYLTEASEKQFSLFFQLHLPSPQLRRTNTEQIIADIHKPWLKLPSKILYHIPVHSEADDNLIKRNFFTDILKDLNDEFGCEETDILNDLKPKSTAKKDEINVCDDNLYAFYDLRCLREEILLGDRRLFDEINFQNPILSINKPQITDILLRLEEQNVSELFQEDFDEFTTKVKVIRENVDSRRILLDYPILDLPKLNISEVIAIGNKCQPEQDLIPDDVNAEITELEIVKREEISSRCSTASTWGKEIEEISSSASSWEKETEEMSSNCSTASLWGKNMDETVTTFNSDSSTQTISSNYTQSNWEEQETSDSPKFVKFDHLQTFLLLRTAEKMQEKCENDKIISLQDLKNEKNEKNEIIKVYLSNEYESLIRLIQIHSVPILQYLSRTNHKIVNFFTLTSDETYLMLKYTGNNFPDENYCSILALDGLIKARDCLIHRSLECAISCLRRFQDYHSLPAFYLDSLRRKLSEIQMQFMENNILHPKMSTLLTIVNQCMQQTPRKKILVTVEDWPVHFDVVFDLIKRLPNVNFDGIRTKISRMELLAKIENCDVLLVVESLFDLNFRWNMNFSIFTVIAYEHRAENEKLSVISDYFGLSTYFQVQDKIPQEIAEKQFEFTLIYSKNVLRMDDLIVDLENRLNIQLSERNYNTISTPPLAFADFTIDERNAILINSFAAINDNKSFNRLINNVIYLSLKFDKCWLLFHALNEENNKINVGNTTKLFTALKTFDKKKDFTFQVLYTGDTTQLANTIYAICQTAKNQSPVWESEQWTNRRWLTPHLTQHEKFLLCFPSINSATAQIMLSSAPLKKLVTISLADLVCLNPQVPERFLRNFHQLVNFHISFCGNVKIEAKCAPIQDIKPSLAVKRKCSTYFNVFHAASDVNPLIKFPRGTIVSTPATIDLIGNVPL
uniref:Uncharacterized protein n=1 Tax=Strigamia maritima TaxID=126957 RepID=T1IKT8_STRMM